MSGTAGRRAARAPTVEVPTRLLVLGMIGDDGTIHADEVYRVAGACGLNDQQIRLYLHRLVTDELFTRHGRGRTAVFHPTGRAHDAVFPDVEFVAYAYEQDHGMAPWDSQWHFVAFAVPETRRSSRDDLRERLRHLGGAAIQGGLYVSPNDWRDYVDTEVRHLGLVSDVATFSSGDLTIGGSGDPRHVAAELWPIDDIASRYERFMEVVGTRLEGLRGAKASAGAEPSVLRAAVEIAIEFDRAMEPDPLLPPELLPARWPGARARSMMSETWRELRRLSSGDLPVFRAFTMVLQSLDPRATRKG